MNPAASNPYMDLVNQHLAGKAVVVTRGNTTVIPIIPDACAPLSKKVRREEDERYTTEKLAKQWINSVAKQLKIKNTDFASEVRSTVFTDINTWVKANTKACKTLKFLEVSSPLIKVLESKDLSTTFPNVSVINAIDISDEELQALANFSTLEKICITSKHITDISCLQHLNSIKELVIHCENLKLQTASLPSGKIQLHPFDAGFKGLKKVAYTNIGHWGFLNRKMKSMKLGSPTIITFY